MVTKKKKTSTKKPSTKKTSVKKRPRKIPRASKKQDFTPYVVGGVAVLVVVVAIVYFLFNTVFATEPTEFEPDPVLTDEAVIILNGEEIMSSEIRDIQSSLQMTSPQQITLSQAAEELVFQKVLVQEAERRDITITSEEVEQEIEAILVQQGRDLEGFRAEVEAQGMDYNAFLEQQKQGLQIERLAMAEVDEEVTDEEVLSFFEDNPQFFEEGTEFEEVELLIRNHLTQEKSFEALIALGQALMMQADIEFLDDDYDFSVDAAQPIQVDI